MTVQCSVLVETQAEISFNANIDIQSTPVFLSQLLYVPSIFSKVNFLALEFNKCTLVSNEWQNMKESILCLLLDPHFFSYSFGYIVL